MAEMLSVISGGFLLPHRFLGVETQCVIVHNHYWRRIARAEHACLRIISIFSEYCSQLESICMHFTSLFPVSAPSKHWIEYPVWCSAGRDVHNIHNYAYTSHISPQELYNRNLPFVIIRRGARQGSISRHCAGHKASNYPTFPSASALILRTVPALTLHQLLMIVFMVNNYCHKPFLCIHLRLGCLSISCLNWRPCANLFNRDNLWTTIIPTYPNVRIFI